MATPMRPILRTLALTLTLAICGCGAWEGVSDVSTDVGGGALGHGPGLFTGKRGAIILYEGTWSGAAPGGGVAE